MKIKNKILLISSLMMLFSLVALLFIGSFVINWYAAGLGAPDSPELNANVFTAEDKIDSFDVTEPDWNTLETELAEDGYKLRVLSQAEGTFVNPPRDPRGMMPFLKDVKNVKDGEGSRAFYINGSTAVVKKIAGYTIIAINEGNRAEVERAQRNVVEVVLKAFVTIGLIAIATILIVSQLFTSWVIRRIMRPINALADGAKRILAGNLSEPVVYEGKDELTAVCSTFNQMQSHLLEERERNAFYEKARTDMIAGISHDLRTPLTSVKGYIKGLRDGVAGTPEKQEQYLSVAYNKAGEMDVLLQKLFYFSKLETGNLPLSLTDEDLGEFVQKFALQSREDPAQANVEIVTDFRAGENRVRIDTEQMHRVLANLTDNAMKYAAADHLTVRITVAREGERVHLRFADNGKGVPEEQLEKLFVQFWRGDEARGQRDGGSSGLGMNIVKYIIEAHGGTVSACNAGGLAVDILLPAGKEAQHE